MANDKIFTSTCRQCITEIEPNNNAVTILKLRVFDSATSANFILSAIEAIDAAAITGAVDIDTILSAVEAVDAIGITTENLISAYLSGSESIDTALFEARALLSAAIAGVEITDIVEITATNEVSRTASLNVTEARDGVNIRIVHPSIERDRTFVPLSRIAHVKFDTSFTARMRVKENPDGCRIEIVTDITPIIAISEPSDGVNIYSRNNSHAAAIISEAKDTIENDVEKFHRDVDALNAKYEKSEIEIFAMVA